jgi:hypothetical protein
MKSPKVRLMIGSGTRPVVQSPLLRFKRIDNLGAYRIPSETGLLIPSVYNK